MTIVLVFSKIAMGKTGLNWTFCLFMPDFISRLSAQALLNRNNVYILTVDALVHKAWRSGYYLKREVNKTKSLQSHSNTSTPIPSCLYG